MSTNILYPFRQRMGCLVAFFCITLAALAARDDERIGRLQEQIRTLEGVVNATKNPSEKTRLDVKLQRLREEISILVERQAIEARQRALADDLSGSPRDTLRERLRAVDRTVEEGEAQGVELANKRKIAAADRDALIAQIDALQGKGDKLADLEERLFTKNEELRAIAMQREAAETAVELAREADRLRARIKTLETNVRPSMRGLFEAYTLVQEEAKLTDSLLGLAANYEQSLTISQSGLALLQQKQAKFDEELVLLEKQTGFFSTDPQIERLLASQRSQKKVLSERVPFVAAQVESVRHAQQYLKTRQELISLSQSVQAEVIESMKKAYWVKLRWPAVALSALLIFNILAGRLLLGLIYKNEALLLARRLCRYACVVLATGVVAGFLFDDLSMVATTLGVVSAALVISLQDVCTSVFGWFVIMMGGKFSVGDRLEIDGARGDVVDIQLMRTMLIEVNGWLGTDQPTGRVIVVPNNFIFKTKVFNYNHGHPYIWGKIDLTVTFATPVAEALALFTRVLEEETIEEFAAARAAADKGFHKRYGIDDAEYRPRIETFIADSGVKLSLFYVSHYRDAISTSSRINARLITELELNSRIQLAYTTMQLLHAKTVSGAPTAVMGRTATASSTGPFSASATTASAATPPLWTTR